MKHSKRKKKIGTEEDGIDNRRNGAKHEVSDLRKTSEKGTVGLYSRCTH
jgi:hypothetical protein